MEGECHFLEGNQRTKKKVQYVKKLLKEIGLEEGRIEMFNMSSSEGPKFAAAADEMTKRAKELGPNPLRAKAVQK